jgi:hypothetical protein
MSTLRAVISMSFYSQLCQNVVFFDNPDGAISLFQAATLIEQQWVARIKAPLPHDVKFTRIQVYDADQPAVQPADIVLALEGDQASDNQLYTVVAWVLQYTTELAGRTQHGRSYIPGVLKGFHTNGVMNINGLNTWTASIDGLMGSFVNPATSGLLLVIKHKNTQLGTTHVANIKVRPTVGTMRTRNIGVGN